MPLAKRRNKTPSRRKKTPSRKAPAEPAEPAENRFFKRRVIGFSPDEDSTIIEEAQRLGVPVARYIRNAAVYCAAGYLLDLPKRINGGAR